MDGTAQREVQLDVITDGKPADHTRFDPQHLTINS